MIFFQNTLRIALWMSLPILALLLLRPLLVRRIRPAVFVTSWMVVLVALLIPWRPTWEVPVLPASVGDSFQEDSTGDSILPAEAPRSGNPLLDEVEDAQLPEGNPMPQLLQNPVQEKAEAAEGLSWPRMTGWQAAALVWVLGVVGIALWQVVRHLRFARLVRRWGRPADASTQKLYRDTCAAMGMGKPPALIVYPSLPSPMLMGLLRPRLLLPATSTYTEEELTYILRHELTHALHRDLWRKALLLCAMTLYWFHPLLYLLARAMSADCEMACDDAVLRGESRDSRRRYGETILAVITRQQGGALALSTHFYEGRKSMKKRFLSMLQTAPRKGSLSLIAGMLVLCLCAGSVLAVSPEAEDTTAQYETTLLATPYPNVTVDTSLLALEESSALSNRSLTLGELNRLYPLYFAYITEGRRPEGQAPVKTEPAQFTLSASLSAYAAEANAHYVEDAINGNPKWRVPDNSDMLPWLLFPDREMTDEELLQLIELEEAHRALEPWDTGSEPQDNRGWTRHEQYRYAQLEEAYEEDQGLRPKQALTDVPNEGLYLLGYNGGGERVYHYPENREMNDEELLQIIHIWKQRRQQADSEYENRMRQLANGEAVGRQLYHEEDAAIEKARQVIQENFAVDPEGLVLTNTYYTEHDSPQWIITFQEDVPFFAPAMAYDVYIEDASGEIVSVDKQLWWSGMELDNESSFPVIGRCAPRYVARDVEDEGWRGMLDEVLSALAFPGTPLEVRAGGIVPHGSAFPVFEFGVVYDNGNNYVVRVDVLNRELYTATKVDRPVIND